MPSKHDFEKLDNGRYRTEGLTEKQFIQLFNIIRKTQNQRRKQAKRTITPAMLRRKSPEDLAKLGLNSNGLPFTREDLLALEKKKRQFQKKYDSKTPGITLAQIIAGSREIDIKRANNQVSDGSGIKQAALISMQGNVAKFKVKASEKNGKQHHEVALQFHEWDDALMNADPEKGYAKAALAAVKGRMSIACSCDRHTFWYRYLATVGNYCLAPPKEFAPPKIRNPNFEGVACKHVLHALNKSTGPLFQKHFASLMEKQARKVGFGDGRKVILDPKDVAKLDRAVRAPIDQSKALREFQKYQQRQEALAKKLSDKNPAIEKARKEALKARKKLQEVQRQADAARAQAQAAEQKAAAAQQQNRDLARQIYDIFRDLHSATGKSDSEIRALAAQRVGMTADQFNSIIND